MDLFSLEGKKAIVTGAGSGLGCSIAVGLAQAKAEVAILDVMPEIGQKAEELSRQGGKFYGIQADLLNRESLRAGFETAAAKLGGVDILVNNAGMQVRGAAEDIGISAWDRLMELNVTAVFELSQMAARVMKAGGGGKIINVASMLSFFGGYRCSPYAASKGAVAQLTKAFSNEWAGMGIQVNAIAPGYMDTPLNTAIINDPKRNEEITLRIPARRWGKPEDLIGTVIFLASPASDYVTGAAIPIDGGYLGR